MTTCRAIGFPSKSKLRIKNPQGQTDSNISPIFRLSSCAAQHGTRLNGHFRKTK